MLNFSSSGRSCLSRCSVARRSSAAPPPRTRDVCGVDRRCGMAVHSLMMRLVEKGLARRHKKGVYLIERAAVEEVLTVLKEWI